MGPRDQPFVKVWAARAPPCPMHFHMASAPLVLTVNTEQIVTARREELGRRHAAICCYQPCCSILVPPFTLLAMAAELFRLTLLGYGMHCRTTSSQHYPSTRFGINWKLFFDSSDLSAVSTSVAELTAVYLITSATRKKHWLIDRA